ncbi:hypothetical protein FALBO_11167 [Fusarium albosuccineum]|uniref:C2H2-type domain-containing protein n=1 Tax=Fusarium albosuccineum TaxID=1237068 RepID=A0A8H4L4P3_9HYPO|nr:hypothetical protein FALBO_11167 [Fusarium albosuccineum]
MASMTDQTFVMFPPQPDSADEYGRYPEHSSAHDVFTTGPMDVSIPADAFSFQQQHQDAFASSMGFVEPPLYAEAPNYMLNSRASPSMYTDESDMRLPSSSLSTASAPSAASSAIGSPQSNHGQMGAVPEWAPQGLGVQPTIVGSDYMTGSDFAPYAGPGMEELNFDFPAPKGFVGKFRAVHSSLRSRRSRSPASQGHWQSQWPSQSQSPSLSPRPLPHHHLALVASNPCPPGHAKTTCRTASVSTTSSALKAALQATQGELKAADPHLAASSTCHLSLSPASSSNVSPVCAVPTITSLPSSSTPSSLCSKRRRLSPSSAAWPTETFHPSTQSALGCSAPPPTIGDVACFSHGSGQLETPLGPSSPDPPHLQLQLSSHINSILPRTLIADQVPAMIDPSLIHPEITRPPMGIPPYDTHFQQPNHTYPASPSASSSSPQPHMMRTNSSSPFLHNGTFQSAFPSSPYGAPMDNHVRAPSMSQFVPPTPGEYSDNESKEKQRCTWPDCGKTFKDLKAHMLTHQNERPEKCPIQTCEYHTKGFARKYDKNRHTLTHYKGTMVCGFCPGSGSAAEKSFNRADVFKRHLTAVHGVEQTPPNSRKKSSTGANSGKKLTGYAPDATGKCSTCSQTFSNAQDFYEHLDDCVLRIVQQEDPAEAINAKRLAEVENDKDVHQTLEKNNLPTTTETTMTHDDDEDVDTGDEDDVDHSPKTSTSPSSRKKGNPANGVQKSRGVTHSRGGVTLTTKTRSRKNRRDYPSSWGFDKGQMTMKKRVMAVFDGPRRLAKDDMMLNTDHEVRIKLSDGKSYVTDLDVQTLKRAAGFHGATYEEKGPWISDDPTAEQLKEMQQMLANNTAV